MCWGENKGVVTCAQQNPQEEEEEEPSSPQTKRQKQNGREDNEKPNPSVWMSSTSTHVAQVNKVGQSATPGTTRAVHGEDEALERGDFTGATLDFTMEVFVGA